MKKTLSFALVLVMLLSALLLTSCDAVTNVLNNFLPQTTTPEETIPAAPKRYTITEAEWEAILKSTNYTWKISTSQDTTYLIADNVAQMTTKQGDVSTTVYAVNKNGTTYQIIDPDNNGQWVASKSGNLDDVFLGKITGIASMEFFEEFQYNEATKSYIAEEAGEKAEFYFEDGNLIKGTITGNSDSNFVWMIENVGTTVVTLPEYTFAEQ